MKKNLPRTIFLLSAAVIAFLSCNDFLDRDPYDEVSSSTVYASATLAESAVVGVYSNLLSTYISYSSTNMDALAIVIDPNETNIYTDYSLLTGTCTSSHDMFLTTWKRCYEGVNRANDVIANIMDTEDLDLETRRCRVAECKFIRAWYYFKLNVLWRGVPIYLENLAPSEYTKARSSEEEVWQVILDDLNDVIDCEDMPDKYSSSDSDYGRISKGAAYALRGKVYMWLEEWALAEADFLMVGECGFGLADLDYADLFTEVNEKCEEMVWTVTMEEETSQGNVYSYVYGNWMTAGNGQNLYYMNANFVDSYQWADGSPFSLEDVIPGYDSMSEEARSVYFLRDDMTETEIATMRAYGADMDEYLSTGNEARILQAYENRDPRLAATVILPYTDYVGGFTGSNVTYQTRFPWRTEYSPDYDLRTRSTANMLYCIRKYVTVGTEYLYPKYNPIDIPIIRYADVLLSLAEAVNEQGGRRSEAVGYVNQVRARAGVALLDSGSDAVAVTGDSDLRQRIQDEKHWELALEEQLYFEELRWGIWVDKKFDDDNGLTQCWGSPVYTYTYGGSAFNLWAIPSSEVEKNPNLEQNPGWN